MAAPRKWKHYLTLICLSSLAGIIGPAFFLVIVFIIDAVQTGHNPIVETISELVHGSYGWLQTLAFFLLGFLLIIFSVRLYLTTVRKPTSQVGAVLLSLAGLGFLMLGAFPSDAGTAGLTARQIAHDAAAGIIGTSFTAGCLVFTVHFRRDPQWKKYWLYSAITVVLCLLFAVMWALPAGEIQARGLDQLLLLICGMLWVEIISIRLLRHCLREAK